MLLDLLILPERRPHNKKPFHAPEMKRHPAFQLTHHMNYGTDTLEKCELQVILPTTELIFKYLPSSALL